MAFNNLFIFFGAFFIWEIFYMNFIQTFLEYLWVRINN